MKYKRAIKNEQCVPVAMVKIIEKRALILEYKTNNRKTYTKSLNNNKNTINLPGKLEFFLVPIKGWHIDVEMLYQVVV